MKTLFQEMSRSSFHINKLEETSLAWCNSHLAVRTDKGIHIYEFSKNLNSLNRKLDFKETFIKTPPSSPCSKLLSGEFVKSHLKNKDIPEMILDTALWPHSEQLVKEMSSVIAFEWSPRGILENNECILAVVNNIGSVQLFVSGRISWISVIDFPSLVQDQLRDISAQEPKSFEDLKQAVYKLESCSLCWSPIVKEGAAYLVTGQKSGTLLFWLIESVNENRIAKFCGKTDADFGEFVNLVWIPKSDKHFVLLCTNIKGQIAAFECHIDKEIVVLSKTYMLWEYEDRMLVQHIQYKIIENQLLLVFHKHRHLVMQLLDSDFKIVSQVVNNVNDYRITSVVKGNNCMYVSTVNFKLYKVNYSIENNVLRVEFDLIVLKDISETCELQSMCFSDNNVICALSTIDRRVLHKKERLEIEIIFLQVFQDDTELDLLLLNPAKQITSYWDCMELIRFKIIKSRTLPRQIFDLLSSEGNTDMYLVKIYLMILTIYKNALVSAKIERMALPEESIEKLKDRITVAHAKSNIEKIYYKQCSKQPLSDLEKECFIGSKKYLELYSQLYKTPLNEIITPNMLELTFEKHYYTCQNCDEEVIDFTCRNGHLNMFCMLTLTPIESLDYLVCKVCGTIARVELKNHKPICIFCDSYMNNSCMPK